MVRKVVLTKQWRKRSRASRKIAPKRNALMESGALGQDGRNAQHHAAKALLGDDGQLRRRPTIVANRWRTSHKSLVVAHLIAIVRQIKIAIGVHGRHGQLVQLAAMARKSDQDRSPLSLKERAKRVKALARKFGRVRLPT
jgi:hypothetical protein